MLTPYAPGDAEDVLALNAANVPEVGPMDRRKLESLAAEADWFPVIRDGDTVVGFAILLTEGASYESPNYRWFSERHERFSYVDRIALGEKARRRGFGSTVYQEAIERARATGRDVLCAEVNTRPPNPASLAFHREFGFEEVARKRPYGPEEEVAMLECAVGRTR